MAYITADDLRTQYPAITEAVATDEVIERHIAVFEDIAERYTGVAYEPREVTVTVDHVCGRRWISDHFRITEVSDLDIAGAAVTGATFSDGYAIDFGSHRTGLMTVTYTHGFPTPPVAILSACYEYVRARVLADNSRVPRDVISQSGDGFTTRYNTPDWEKRRPTGYVDVDALLNSVTQYRKPAAY